MTRDTPLPYRPAVDALNAQMIFVSGKGGVGKTLVSRALARHLSAQGKRTLWVTFEDPLMHPGTIEPLGPSLWSLNCEAESAFREYIGLKLGMGSITRLFLQNKLVHYLSKAAPGIHELVLLGKVWFERKNYDRVVVDMPSTGYGLAMFHSAKNFSRLFQGGPIQRDAEAMIQSLASPSESAHLVVALPEEMPLQEGLELAGFLNALFPTNAPGFVANRILPGSSSSTSSPKPRALASALAATLPEYIQQRHLLEEENLKLWDDAGLKYLRLPYLPPQEVKSLEEQLARQWPGGTP